MSCVSTRQTSWLTTKHMSCVSTLRCAQCSQPTERKPQRGAAEGRPPLWRRPKAASFVLAVNTGHILVLRRKTCALLRAKTSALLRRKTCAVLAARASLSPGASQFETVAKNSTFIFLELRAAPEPPQALPKLLQTLPEALPGPPSSKSSVSLKREATFSAKVAFCVDETRVWHTPADPPDPADRRSEVRPRPSLPHAPGVRMTAVTTNSLKLL